MEEANPIEANDSDYDPTKDAKKEVRTHKDTVVGFWPGVTGASTGVSALRELAC